MLKLLESIPVFGPFVVSPILTAGSWTVDRALDAVSFIRLIAGL